MMNKENAHIKEFIALMALLMSTVALAIDAILPALGFIAKDLSLINTTDVQYVVTFLFMGLAIGQLIYGPLSDSLGRKPTLFAGIFIFMIGCVISYTSQNLEIMLLGRFIQGLGAAGPRIITTAIIRDRYEGRTMAKIMSMIMGVFILVPAIAPSLGQLVRYAFGWRAIFLFYMLVVTISGLWALKRLDETHPPEKRSPLEIKRLYANLKETFSNRKTLGYAVANGLSFSILLSYLSIAQLIFQEIFDTGEYFPLYFGALAGAIGVAFFVNSALVQKYGTRKITTSAMIALSLGAAIFVLYDQNVDTPNLWAFMAFGGLSFFCLGMTFGNTNAMAMQPMGHIAGMASAFVGSLATAISIIFSSIIGHFYNGTLHPLSIGFLALGITTVLLIIWIEGGIKNALNACGD